MCDVWNDGLFLFKIFGNIQTIHTVQTNCIGCANMKKMKKKEWHIWFWIIQPGQITASSLLMRSTESHNF